MPEFTADVLFAVMALVIASAAAMGGAVRAGVRLVGLLFAGLLAMNYFEPLSDSLGDLAGEGGFVADYRDFGSLIVLLAAFFLLLRAATNRLMPESPDLPRWTETIGRWAFGLLTGYLAAAILLTAVHTFPGSRDFGGLFPPEADRRSGPLMRLAPDYQWLGFTQHVSEHIFRYPGEGRVFDARKLNVGTGAVRFSSFPLRYAQWRAQRESSADQQE